MRALIRIRKEPHYRRSAFEQGLKRVGFTLVDRLERPNGPEDWACFWNRKKGADERDADAWEAAGGTVIVAENGYLQKTDKTTYAISVHGHNGSGWSPIGPEDRFTKLGFEIKPWRDALFRGEIVIRAQRGVGSTLMASPSLWAEKTLMKVRDWVGSSMPARIIQHPGNYPPKVPVEKDLARAAMFVTWCSAMGVRALIEGIPVFYAAPHWICEGAGAPWKEFAVCRRSDEARLLALHRMSHSQWHFDEIATGEPFARIIANRSKATW